MVIAMMRPGVAELGSDALFYDGLLSSLVNLKLCNLSSASLMVILFLIVSRFLFIVS